MKKYDSSKHKGIKQQHFVLAPVDISVAPVTLHDDGDDDDESIFAWHDIWKNDI